MGTAERRDREKKQLRREILSAARELFAREGYENLSMRRIAQKIEYSPTTIYLYFKDKDELIGEVCQETFVLLTKKLRKAFDADAAPLDRLKAGLKIYVDFALKYPDHYRATLMTPHWPEDHKPAEADKSEGMRAFQCLIDAVTACVAAGLFRESDVMLISQFLWTSIHGMVSLWISMGEFPWVDKDQLLEFSVESSIRGLLK